MPVGPGTYNLNLTKYYLAANGSSIGSYTIRSLVTGLVVNGNTVQDISITYPKLVTLQGKTTDANGIPVGGVTLDVFISPQDMESSGVSFQIPPDKNKSAADGSFSYQVIVGNYNETIRPPAGSGFLDASLSLSLQANLNQAIVLPFSDTINPVITSGPIIRSLTSTSAVLEWQTDEPTKGAVKLGATTVLASDLLTTHSVQITGLTPSTAYTAEVSATDATGNGPTLKTASFTTAAAADVIAPVILEGPTVSGASATSLVVQWSTSEPTKGALSYGLGTALNASVLETALSVAHRIELTGLTADSSYSVRVSATDAANNGPTMSRTRTGRTLPTPDTSAPIIINGPLVSDITHSAAMVKWKTDEPSSGGVSWNDGVAYGVLSDDKLDTEHSARITGLVAGKTYHLTVSSKDALGNGPTLSKTVDFATQAQADIHAPELLTAPSIVSITHQSAVVQWETDEPTDSQVSYGITTLDKSDSRAALTKKHSLALVGLTPATTYQVQVRSSDSDGRVSPASAIASFSTRANADTVLPIFDTPPAVGYTTDKKAVLQWKTDKLTDSQVTITPITFDEPPRIKDDGQLKGEHEVSVTGLTPNKTYSVAVTSTDLWGNTVSQPMGEFTTPPMPDSQAPSITSGPSVQANATTATVSWSTDKLADSKASYGPSGSALSQVSGDIAYSKQHSVVLSKLLPSTAYQVQVASSDPSGNGPALSARVSFVTVANNGQSSTTTTATTSTTGVTTSTTGVATSTTVGSTTTTTLNTSTGQTTLNLAAGWNLIGNGYETSFNVATVLGDAANFTTVWKWLVAKSNWAFYAPALTAQQLIDYTASKGYEVLASIQAGEGFWVNTKQAVTVNLPSATPIASNSYNPAGSRPLAQGWSLIATGDNPTSGKFNNNLSLIHPSPGSTPANLTSLWAWDTANAGWYFWAPSLANAGTLQTYITSKGYLDFALIPGTPLGTLSATTGVWVNRP
jgi:phosphodiesterase/alkaline phosphatase D-like protein